ncbi:MAG: hypothetical protein C5B48_15610 [Candidatus Rokuibacteriota bacterium]|nr:MAG: hypothetical protein C5B48_15610 [Candidatus Rokubacteria bacterium]
MLHRATLQLCALLVTGLVVLLPGLPAAAAPDRAPSKQRHSSSTCGSVLCVPIEFSGTGTATTTSTIHNPDGSTSSFTYKDTFSWRVVYDVPFGGRRHYQSGWNVIGVQADTGSTFTGTSDESCTAPSGGSCVVGGGGSSCRGNFENTRGIPLQLLVYSPPHNGTWKLAAPAHQASQRTSGSCGSVARALDDTCDPLWKGPFPGQGENTPVTARFSLTPRLILWSPRAPAPKPVHVSGSKSWSCTGSNGTSTDKGSIEWHGTVKAPGCSEQSWRASPVRSSAAHTARPLWQLVPAKKNPGPELPSWLKIHCDSGRTIPPAYDQTGKVLIPAKTIYHCKLKLSFSYLKGIVKCETPVLVTATVTAYFDLNGTPVIEAEWGGPILGTGSNVWRGLSKAYKGLRHILENYIPVG